MRLAADLWVALVALVHVGIAIVEMFLWTRPAVYRRIERLALTDEEARKVAPIVANAGLYNGFLAAGLIWGLIAPGDNSRILAFFLACVVIAGAYGAATLKRTTLVLQAAPGAIGLLLIWLSRTHAS